MAHPEGRWKIWPLDFGIQERLSRDHYARFQPAVLPNGPGNLEWQCLCGEQWKDAECQNVLFGWKKSWSIHLSECKESAISEMNEELLEALKNLSFFQCTAYNCRNESVAVIDIFENRPYCALHTATFYKRDSDIQQITFGENILESTRKEILGTIKTEDNIPDKDMLEEFFKDHKERPVAYIGDPEKGVFKCSCGWASEIVINSNIALERKLTFQKHFAELFPESKGHAFPYTEIPSFEKSVPQDRIAQNVSPSRSKKILITEKRNESRKSYKGKVFLGVIVLLIGAIAINHLEIQSRNRAQAENSAKQKLISQCFSINDENIASQAGPVGSKERIQSTSDFYTKVLSSPCVIWSDGGILSNPFQGINSNSIQWQTLQRAYAFTLKRWNGIEPFTLHCADGWSSQSIGKKGACSHHGGVVNDFAINPTWSLVNDFDAGSVLYPPKG